ncbi:MAG: hypothetical protein MMC33_002175 [Icmadophila ericetorum]|nr:hypothetical protein [Icmadophila ericetorum]
MLRVNTFGERRYRLLSYGGLTVPFEPLTIPLLPPPSNTSNAYVLQFGNYKIFCHSHSHSEDAQNALDALYGTLTTAIGTLQRDRPVNSSNGYAQLFNGVPDPNIAAVYQVAINRGPILGQSEDELPSQQSLLRQFLKHAQVRLFD